MGSPRRMGGWAGSWSVVERGGIGEGRVRFARFGGWEDGWMGGFMIGGGEGAGLGRKGRARFRRLARFAPPRTAPEKLFLCRRRLWRLLSCPNPSGRGPVSMFS